MRPIDIAGLLGVIAGLAGAVLLSMDQNEWGFALLVGGLLVASFALGDG